MTGRRVRTLLLLCLASVLAGCAAPAAVEREPASAARLSTRVKAALVDEPNLAAAAIFVDAKDGRVRLSGFADSNAKRERAARVARGVPGVTAVENHIRVR